MLVQYEGKKRRDDRKKRKNNKKKFKLKSNNKIKIKK